MRAEVWVFGLEHYGLLLILAFVLFGVGRQLLRRLEFGSVLEEISFSTALGMGVFGTVVFLLGLVRLIYWQSIVGILILMVVVSLQTWRSVAGRMLNVFRELRIRKFRFWAVAVPVAVIAVVILLPIFAEPLYPPYQWDAISYHLAVAKSYATNHSVEPLPHLRFCVFPQLMNMMFTAALLLQDDIAAQLVSFLAMLLTAMAVIGWGGRKFSFRAGVLGAALLLGSPMILLLGSSAYIDMGLTMFVTLAVVSFLNWGESRQGGWALLAGLLLGFSSGVKYTGAFLALAFLAVLIAQTWKERRWRLVGGFVLAVLLTGGPWYVRNVVYTGDPFFPMLGRTVPNSCWSAADADAHGDHLAGLGPPRSLVSFVRLPWDLTFNQMKFLPDIETPSARPIFFLLPLAIWFAVINTVARRLMFVVLAFSIFWFLFAPLIRYLQPIVPLWSLATAAALDHLASRLRTGRAATILISLGVCAFLLWYGRESHLPQHNPMPVTELQRDIHYNRFPTYACYEWLNRREGSDYRVYGLGDEFMAYFPDGVRLGDHLGPGRYRDLDLNTAAGLYRSLRKLNVEFLMAADLGQLTRVRADPQFERYFRLVCGNPSSMVWRLTQNGIASARGGNAMPNPSLETVLESGPSEWGKVGEPHLDTSGAAAKEGTVAFRAAFQNFYFQTVPVVGDQLYELRFWARAAEAPAQIQIDLHWIGEGTTSLGASTHYHAVGSEWTEVVLPLTSPLGTKGVVLYPHSSDQPVWFDDFSMRPILNPER